MLKIAMNPKPYVGMEGSGNTLQLQNLEDRVVIRFAPGQYIFTIFILVAFGSLLTLIALKGFPHRHDGGLFYHAMQYGCWAFAALLWYILIRDLLGMPRIEVPKGSGEIQFFKYRAGGPEFVIRWSEVQRFVVGMDVYTSGRATYPQHVLSLNKKSGGSVSLCGSTDEKLISRIKTEMEGVVGCGLNRDEDSRPA